LKNKLGQNNLGTWSLPNFFFLPHPSCTRKVLVQAFLDWAKKHQFSEAPLLKRGKKALKNK
jgi:hypothetical protein